MNYRDWFEENEKKILDDYFTYLRFPSISAQPKFAKDVENCALWVANNLKSMDFEVELWRGKGHPVVYGTRIVKKGAPIVLLYGHYDVQPPEPLELWETDPFDPKIVNERVYARGAQDNKGQSFYFLTALKAFKKDINFKVVLEGEEEIGSSFLSSLIDEKRKELEADYALVVDSTIGSLDSPSITVGLKGCLFVEVNIKTSEVDLHSGSFGGIAYNPCRALVDVLSSCVNDKGIVQVPHFYDGVVQKEDLSYVNTHFDKEFYLKCGLKGFHFEEGYTPVESNFFRPTFEIIGIYGGYTGKGTKTIIPSEATAKISCRLVPGQDPVKIHKYIDNHLQKFCPKFAKVTCSYLGGCFAVRSSPNDSLVKLAQQACTNIFGSCKLVLSGASVPITYNLSTCAKHLVLLGTGTEEDKIHSPNESFGLMQFKKGFLLTMEIFELILKS